jgi:simple sugar transport system permease protein
MTAFAAALETDSVAVGFAAGAATGAMIAVVVAFISLILGRSQVAVGFVLALLCRDLSYLLGNAYTRLPGPQVAPRPVPGLADLPVVGPVLFNHNWVVYLSLAAVAAVWVLLFRTHLGLKLRGVGERPAAAFARGVNVTRLRISVSAAGGAMVGVGGAAYSLFVKPGWARPYGIEGVGWIALAIVVFGGWRPLRAALGVYLFVALQTAAGAFQSALPEVPTQLLAALPFPLMILTLLLVTLGNAEWLHRALGAVPVWLRPPLLRVLGALQASPPAALGSIEEQR